MNIVDPILLQCRINAEQPAICAPGTRFDLVTYAQLEYMINNVTRALLPLGFEPGQVVGILMQDKIFHIVLMLALTRIGAVTVSCSGPSLPPEIGVAAIISDTSQPVTGANRVILANPDWVKGSANPVVDPRLYKTAGDAMCRIVLTSGSTGTPKAVAWTHRMLLERNAQFDYCYGSQWPHSSRLYCDMGLSSGPAFRYLCYMLMRGGMIMLFGADELVTEQSLDLFKIQNMVTTPRGLGEHVKFYNHTKVRCYLDHVLVVGGNLSKELAERAWAVMCPRLVSYYGATEAGSIASADARDVAGIPNAIGYVLPEASVEIVDESENPLGVNIEGIVRVRTPQMVSSYVGQPQASALAFRHGWFYPGDYGFVAHDGLLAITGRVETRINVGGDKTNPERIEEILRTFPGVVDAAVLTMPNAVGLEDVYALIQANDIPDDTALRTHCQTQLQRSFVPVRFIVVDRIPRSETGKIQRGKLLELVKSRLN